MLPMFMCECGEDDEPYFGCGVSEQAGKWVSATVNSERMRPEGD